MLLICLGLFTNWNQLAERQSEKFLNSLAVEQAVLGVQACLVVVDSLLGEFANNSLQLFLEQAFLVHQVLVRRVEVSLLHVMFSICWHILDILEQVPIADIFVEFVNLVANLLHAKHYFF